MNCSKIVSTYLELAAVLPVMVCLVGVGGTALTDESIDKKGDAL
jgi:hypothetical protein